MPLRCPTISTNEELIPKLRGRRYRRVPVYGETPDDILGVLDVREFLLLDRAAALHRDAHLAELRPGDDESDRLAQQFLRLPQGLAIVVDEHGGTEGIITMADIVEEIISDAVPTADHSLYIENAGEGRLIVNGNARLDDISELLGVKLEEDGIDTIGGLDLQPPRHPAQARQQAAARESELHRAPHVAEADRRGADRALPGSVRGREPRRARGIRLDMIWTAVAFCLLVSFIFSGIEAGIFSVNRVRLKHRVKLRDRAALRLKRLLATPERLLVTVLIVTNLMNISAIILTTQELVHHFGTGGYFLSLAISLPVYLIGLELLPKSLFRRFPYRALAALAVPLRVADMLLAPVHFVSGRLYRTFLRRTARAGNGSSSSRGKTSSTSPSRASAAAPSPTRNGR